MRRYESVSDVIKDRTVKRYSTSRYPFVPFRDTDIYIIGRSRQRLDNLAYEYYGDPKLWWVIAEVNNIGKGTLSVPVNKRLRIPYPISEPYIEQLINQLDE